MPYSANSSCRKPKDPPNLAQAAARRYNPGMPFDRYLPIFLCGLMLLAGISLQHCKTVDISEPEKKSPVDTTTYTCEGKTTCGQMRTCGEAQYYLSNCPDVTLDGDFDGIPCEEQLCGH